MIKTWTEKTGKIPTNPMFTLAPDWYIEAKAAGANEEGIFEIVRDFCREALIDEAKSQGKTDFEEPDENLVKLMIQTYEAE